jgi:uncharacterized iron-regulated membrane protein
VNGFVQRLKQLHLLLGLVVGWLLLLIIFTGSLSFYRAELDNLQLFKLASATQAVTDTSRQQVRFASSAALAQTFLAQQAPTASQWYIELPQQRKPYLTLHWLQPSASGQGVSQLYQQLLHASSGQPLTAALPIKFGATDHQLGGLFFQLHYNVLQLFGPVSRSLVAYLALLWLLLSIAGLLSLRGRWRTLWRFSPSPANPETTRTLRHNQLAVLTLPFALLFASSGWLTQMFSENSAPQRQLYPGNPYQFYAELFPPAQPFAGARQNDPAPLPDLAALVVTAEQQLALPVGKISVTLPGTGQSTVLLSGSAAAQVSNHLPSSLFGIVDATWQQLPEADSGTRGPLQSVLNSSAENASQTAIAQIRSTWYGLHQSLYASSWLRLVLFVSGMLCCWMIWLGLRSWLQRQSAAFWRQIMLPITAVTSLALVLGSSGLILIQLLPSGWLVGYSLSQQLLALILVTAFLVCVTCWRRLAIATN